MKSGFGVYLRALVTGVNVVRSDVGVRPKDDAMFHLGIEPKITAQRYRLQ